ncbi:MAG: hypothetical protein D6796_00285 [Caldilineae bacterium]|nr:MAG: hypothetical protein D6796_00285 [Caldilineae bacterium]
MDTFSVGWVLRSSTTDFAVGCRVLGPETPRFGDFVKVRAGDEVYIIGLIYDVRVSDDPSVRQLILAGELTTEAVRDQRENRLVPIEVSVLAVGYRRGRRYFYNLPPQPPISLDVLERCTPPEIIAFTERLDYLRLILKAGHVPADELIVASLERAASLQAAERRRPFLVQAGRELARLLGADLIRLEDVLRQLRQALAT